MVTLALTAALTAPAAHVTAARLAAITYQLDANVLLAIAEHETHWDSTLVNGRSCGAMQVATIRAGQCQALKDVTLSYLEGARVLRAWLAASNDNLSQALAHYACGNNATHRDCRGFAHWAVARGAAYQRDAQS